jgi:hypothetical protein
MKKILTGQDQFGKCVTNKDAFVQSRKVINLFLKGSIAHPLHYMVPFRATSARNEGRATCSSLFFKNLKS